MTEIQMTEIHRSGPRQDYVVRKYAVVETHSGAPKVHKNPIRHVDRHAAPQTEGTEHMQKATNSIV